jgi:hypothetical protein
VALSEIWFAKIGKFGNVDPLMVFENFFGNDDGLSRTGADAPVGNSPTREGGVASGQASERRRRDTGGVAALRLGAFPVTYPTLTGGAIIYRRIRAFYYRFNFSKNIKGKTGGGGPNELR